MPVLEMPSDTVGLGAVMNLISKEHQDFFAAGGTGILVGDGRLSYGPEGISRLTTPLRSPIRWC
jgi:hypothetical protein